MPPSPSVRQPWSAYKPILQCLFLVVVVWEVAVWDVVGRADLFGLCSTRTADLESQLKHVRAKEQALQQRVLELQEGQGQGLRYADAVDTNVGNGARPPSPDTVTTCGDTLCEGSNSYGRWQWRRDGKHIDDLLVVIGGERYTVDTMLVDEGYKVWTTRHRCNKKVSRMCQESLGYVGYLADPDPQKPIARSVAFIHGHEHAWHHSERNITDLLSRGLRCGKHYRRYLPLHPEVHAPGLWRYARFWVAKAGLWNKHFSEHRKIPSRMVVAPTSAQFIIPEQFVRDNQTFFSGRAEELGRKGNTTGIFWEYVWHIAMGEPDVLDVYKLIPQCLPPNHLLEDEVYASRVYSTLKGAVVDRYMQAIHTNNTGSGWKAGVLVVFGNHLGTGTEPHTTHPSLVRKVQSMGYNVWLRHPESAACKDPGNGKRTGLCYEELGYLTYLSRSRPKQQAVVFLRGDEPLSFVDRLPEAVACARNTGGYIALETGMSQAHYDMEAARLPTYKRKLSLVRLTHLFIENESIFYPKLRNLPEVLGSGRWPPAPLDEEELLVPRLGSHFVVPQSLIDRAPLDHYKVVLDTYGKSGSLERYGFAFYWHLIFGGTARHPSPFGDELCVAQTLRPFLSLEEPGG